MDQEKKFCTTFDQEKFNHKVTLQVMAHNRYGACPKALVHFELVIFDTTQPKNIMLQKLQKSGSKYKEVLNFSSRNGNPLIISQNESGVEASIFEISKNKGFPIHEIVIEMFISPLIEEIRDQYKLKTTRIYSE